MQKKAVKQSQQFIFWQLDFLSSESLGFGPGFWLQAAEFVKDERACWSCRHSAVKWNMKYYKEHHVPSTIFDMCSGHSRTDAAVRQTDFMNEMLQIQKLHSRRHRNTLWSPQREFSVSLTQVILEQFLRIRPPAKKSIRIPNRAGSDRKCWTHALRSSWVFSISTQGCSTERTQQWVHEATVNPEGQKMY